MSPLFLDIQLSFLLESRVLAFVRSWALLNKEDGLEQ